MPFNGIAYQDLWQRFCSADCNNLCNFDRSYYEKQFSEIILNLVKWVRRRCRLNISYLELWRSSCLVERNQLCNFERRHHGEHSCEVI